MLVTRSGVGLGVSVLQVPQDFCWAANADRYRNGLSLVYPWIIQYFRFPVSYLNVLVGWSL